MSYTGKTTRHDIFAGLIDGFMLLGLYLQRHTKLFSTFRRVLSLKRTQVRVLCFVHLVQRLSYTNEIPKGLDLFCIASAINNWHGNQWCEENYTGSKLNEQND